jgi:transcriptional regulator with XRE-family HTH domain
MGSEFPERLRRLRERRRMNRKAMGECCGLSKNIIGMYERGEKEPSLKTLIKIADFFEVSTDYLLGRKNFL